MQELSGEKQRVVNELIGLYFGSGFVQDDHDKTQQKLTEHVVYMLLHEMEKLLQLLYRIDVQESKVKQAFAQREAAAIAPEIARLIMERILQKAESRLRFRT